MQRREVLVTLAAATAVPHAWAHHGWSSFDTSRPIYLAGRIARLSWANPHAELQLEVDTDLKLPEGLATRTVPEQQARVDMKDLLTRAVVPTRKDKLWQIELAPLFTKSHSFDMSRRDRKAISIVADETMLVRLPGACSVRQIANADSEKPNAHMAKNK